jgi:hypothetical protein
MMSFWSCLRAAIRMTTGYNMMMAVVDAPEGCMKSVVVSMVDVTSRTSTVDEAQRSHP